LETQERLDNSLSPQLSCGHSRHELLPTALFSERGALQEAPGDAPPTPAEKQERQRHQTSKTTALTPHHNPPFVVPVLGNMGVHMGAAHAHDAPAEHHCLWTSLLLLSKS